MAIQRLQKKHISQASAVVVLILNIFFNFLQPLEDLALNIISMPIRINNFLSQELGSLLTYRILAANYKRISHESDKLYSDVIRFGELSEENERLKRLLQFKEENDYPLVISRIIARDSYLGNQIVIIDKGKNRNLKKGSAIVTNAGLVGKISEVNDTTSKVVLISDPNLSVAVIIEGSRQQGLLQGSFYSLCKVRYLDSDAIINIGDIVLTSGLGGVFPKGIVVGKIVSVSKEIGMDMQYAVVKPEVNLNRIEEVFVVTE